MNRTSSVSRSQPSRAAAIISASRWQTVPVVICCTRAPERARRRASLSVARSPTSAATRQRALSSVRVRSSRAVLPAPGLDTRVTTQTPASWNRRRSSRARKSFFLRTLCRTSTIRGCTFYILHCSHFQRGELELPAANHVRGRRAAHWALEALDARQLPLLAAGRTEDHHRDVFDLEAGPFDGSARGREVEREQERVGHHSGERPEPQVQGFDADSQAL